MKKLHLLFLLFLTTVSVNAQQRHADLTTRLLQPKNGDTIYTDDQFAISFMVYNLGSDTIRFTDSMGMGLIFDGSPILFYVDTVTTLPYLGIDGIEIVPGDSTPINFGFTLSQGWTTGPASFCVRMTPFNAADSISDTVIANDLSCASIKIMDQPVGITKVKSGGLNTIEIYPNPAHNEVNLDMNITKAGKVTVKIQDIAGRVILEEDEGYLSNGTHHIKLNTANYNPGLYFYHVIAGADRISGKLQIQ